jgi:hypothetical protein
VVEDVVEVGVEVGDVVEDVVEVGEVVEVVVGVEVEEIAMSDAMLAHLLNELQKKVAKLEIRIFELEKVQVKTDAALYRARRTLALLLATEKGVKRVQGKEGPVGDGAGEGG